MDLKNLFDTYKSDKGWHGYPAIYESYFNPIREYPITLLELGVMHGYSLLAWRDYFPNGEITGFDDRFTGDLGERIHTHLGHQEDTNNLEEVASHCGPFDIIVDDCGHYWRPQQVSFEYLWSHVKKGGFYIIEDLGTSFNLQYGSPDWEKTTDYLKKFVDIVINREYRGSFQDVEFIHFYTNIAILKKKE